MKTPLRFTTILLIISVLLVSCASPSVPTALHIENEDFTCAIGETASLVVKDENQNTLSSKNILWESSNYEIVSIDKNGLLTAKSGGWAEITAKHKSNLSLTDSIKVFVPYHVTEAQESTVDKFDRFVSEDFENLLTFTKKYSILLLKSVKPPSILTINTVIPLLFGKNNYILSMARHKATAQNAIIYSFCDWTNSNVLVDLNALSEEQMYKDVQNSLGIDEGVLGNSFEMAMDSVRTALAGHLSNDGNFYFKNMDQAYQYRIVVRADFDHLKLLSYYSNGLITGLGYTIADIPKMDWDEISNNYTYQIISDEILNITNAHLCIEFREMPCQ